MIYKSIPFQEEDLCLAPRILLSIGMTHHEREVVGDGGEPNLWCPIRRREAQQATHLDHLAPQPATANFFPLTTSPKLSSQEPTTLFLRGGNNTTSSLISASGPFASPQS
jgi:hypothetical protein